MFRRTLASIGVERADVETVRGSQPVENTRAWFLGEAMRPAATTNTWAALANSQSRERARAGLKGVSLIEAKSTDEEAEVVALILRRAADDPHTTAALISPDRLLARRVAARLASFGITVDDSAGRPFGKTPPGTLLDLTLEVVDSGFSPVAVMSLLKHPLVRLGASVSETRRAARALELLALRQPYLGEGLPGLRVALERAMLAKDRDSGERPARALNAAARRLKEDAVAAAADVLSKLEEAFAPLLELGRDDRRLSELSAAHVATAEALAADEKGDAGRLWAEEAGETAATFLAKLMDASIPGPSIPLSAYPEFYRSLVTGLAVRERRPVHPRLSIWGPFESRLMQPDIVVLGGLNDGTWPEIADPDPWLSRPMLKALGLPSPEAQLGYAAHDFASLAGAPRVYLTRSLKVDGNPTVASRWLLRIEALADGLGLAGILAAPKEDAFANWAANRDARAVIAEVNAPAPRPPLAARPRQMSVTRIEQWLANPYAIFAREILRLELLPELGSEPDASLRGQLIHDALNRFQTAHPTDLPEDVAAVVEQLSNTVFREFVGHPRVAAFWRPRFRRFAEWFAETEPERREGISRVHSEVKGLTHFLAPAGPFILTARADRLDLSTAGRLTITDYKTGTPPADGKVVSGRAPQLALEAHIASEGGFEGLAKLPIEALRFIRVSGGEPPGEERNVKCESPGILAQAAAEGLLRLITLFDDPSTPYQALRRPGFEDAYRFDDYRHLARTDEWAERGDDN